VRWTIPVNKYPQRFSHVLENMNKKLPYQTLKNQQRLYVLWIGFVFFALMVIIGAIPGEAENLSSMVDDRLLHFSAYCLLTGLVYSGLNGSTPLRALKAFVIIGLLSGLDETIQGFMAYRHADMKDLVFDFLAATITLIALVMLEIGMTRRRKERLSALRRMRQANRSI
jgi:VanZ family protein